MSNSNQWLWHRDRHHAQLRDRPIRRDQRGLSQSTESAVLLIGAITIAAIVIAAVTNYVQSKLQGLA